MPNFYFFLQIFLSNHAEKKYIIWKKIVIFLYFCKIMARTFSVTCTVTSYPCSPFHSVEDSEKNCQSNRQNVALVL